MELPKAEELRALLTAARDCGVTRLRVSPDGGIEAEMAPAASDAQPIAARPLLEDPLDIVRREVAAGNTMPARDLLDVVTSGGRFVPAGSGDPTRPE